MIFGSLQVSEIVVIDHTCGSDMLFKRSFHNIATIVAIADKNSAIATIEMKSISAIAVATIAGEWFPYDRCENQARTMHKRGGVGSIG